MEQVNISIINYDDYREPVVFGLLIVFAVPAIILSLFILTFFFSQWNLMIQKTIHHHAIFLLIIISFLYTTFDLPFSINYFRIGQHPYRSIPFCLCWYWFDYSLLTLSLTITATASIQRHILIFHSQWLQVNRTRWILHYLPLIISTIYPPLFYIVFIFLYPCTVYFNRDDGWCAYPCYTDDPVMFDIDWFINSISPVFIIVLANITLIIRVVRSMKRIRRQQRCTWKTRRKLTVQLLSFSSLYLIIWFSTSLLAIIRTFVVPNLYNDLPNLYYINYLIYFVCPLQTFPCIFALPEIIDFMKRKRNRLLGRSMIVPTVSLHPHVQQTTKL